MKILIYLLLFLCFFVVLKGDHDKNDSQNVFVPTDKWQVVKKNQPLPPGLHYRLNLETHVTEAKKITPEDDKNKDQRLTVHPDANVNSDSKDATKPSQVKQQHDSKDEIARDDQETKKLRRYQEIKEGLEALQQNLTGEAQVLSKFLDKFELHQDSLISGNINDTRLEEILDILNDLEYLVHFVDKAQLFADIGGMSKVISPCLNSTVEKIKLESLRVLGAAVQLNPYVQSKALEQEYVQKLLHMLASSPSGKTQLRSRCLFALGALVRQFPAGQKVLVDHGGLELLGNILDTPEERPQQHNIQRRVLSLVNDLLEERRTLQYDKIQAYAQTDLKERLLGHNYCTRLLNLLSKLAPASTGNTSAQEDLFESILQSLFHFHHICKADFLARRDDISAHLTKLLRFYADAPEKMDLLLTLEKIRDFFKEHTNTLRDEL